MPIVAGQSIIFSPRDTLIRLMQEWNAKTLHVRLATGIRTGDTTTAFGNEINNCETINKANFLLYERKSEGGYNPGLITLSSALYDNTNDYAKHPRIIVNFTPTEDWLSGYDCVAVWEGGSNTATVAATADASTNVFTSASHGLIAGEDIMIGGSPVPSGITAATLYKALNVTTNTFQVSLDGTNPIDISDSGTNVFLRYAKGNLFFPVWVGSSIISAYAGAIFSVPIDWFMGSVNPNSRTLQ